MFGSELSSLAENQNYCFLGLGPGQWKTLISWRRGFEHITYWFLRLGLGKTKILGSKVWALAEESKNMGFLGFGSGWGEENVDFLGLGSVEENVKIISCGSAAEIKKISFRGLGSGCGNEKH